MKKLIWTGLILFLTINVQAQDSFNDVLDMDDKKFNKKTISLHKLGKPSKDGTGIAPDLTKKEIKKVALVSYNLQAPDSWSKYGSNTYKVSATDQGTDYFVNKLYSESIADIQAAFSDKGIELITIENMTDEQKKVLQFSNEEWEAMVYENYDEKKAKKLTKNFKSLNKKDIGVSADGYRNWKNIYGTSIYWNNEVFAAMAEALNVDAILLVNNKLELGRKEFSYESSYFALVGLNPIPKEEGKWYPGLSHCDGMMYGSVEFKPKNAIPFVELKKNNVESENYDGFGEVMEKVVRALLDDIEERSKED